MRDEVPGTATGSQEREWLRYQGERVKGVERGTQRPFEVSYLQLEEMEIWRGPHHPPLLQPRHLHPGLLLPVAAGAGVLALHVVA